MKPYNGVDSVALNANTTLSSSKIYLNDLLQLNSRELDYAKVRLNIDSKYGSCYTSYLHRPNVIDWALWKWDYKVFDVGQTVIGLLRINPMGPDFWLLYYVGRITKDLGVTSGVGYSSVPIPSTVKWCERVIVKYHNHSRGAMTLNANTIINDLEVFAVLPDRFKVL